MGIKLTPMSMMSPTIILTLAIADSIHVLVTLFREMRQGASKRDAIVESLRVNFGPVFLTSLTTVIGFMSLNFSDAPPFHDLGRITAMGVTAAWIYSILFLPAPWSRSCPCGSSRARILPLGPWTASPRSSFPGAGWC